MPSWLAISCWSGSLHSVGQQKWRSLRNTHSGSLNPLHRGKMSSAISSTVLACGYRISPPLTQVVYCNQKFDFTTMAFHTSGTTARLKNRLILSIQRSSGARAPLGFPPNLLMKNMPQSGHFKYKCYFYWYYLTSLYLDHNIVMPLR